MYFLNKIIEQYFSAAVVDIKTVEKDHFYLASTKFGPCCSTRKNPLFRNSFFISSGLYFFSSKEVSWASRITILQLVNASGSFLIRESSAPSISLMRINC